MGSKSKIEWTEDTWNPIVGCSIATPGCTNCYAMKMANRIVAMNPNSHYAGTVQDTKVGAVWTGKVALAPEKILTAPLRRKKPTMYFVNSMGDVFHESVPNEWIDRCVAVMALTPQHTYQVLTKRSERMRDYMREFGPNRSNNDRMYEIDSIVDQFCADNNMGRYEIPSWPLQNVWLGVSAERQKEWDERKNHLRETPAAVRFASFEPLLGPIIEPEPISNFIKWAIVGGESGKGARPMHPDWARSLRDQCADGVAFFFKQYGEYEPLTVIGRSESGEVWRRGPDGKEIWFFDELNKDIPIGDVRFSGVGKKKAGRLLDGIEHNGMPA